MSLAEAKNYCRALGEGMHLVTDAEWMSIAEQIAGLPINDVDGAEGLQLGNGNNANLQIYANTANADNANIEPNVDSCDLYKSLADAENAFSATCQLQGTNGNTNDFGYSGTNANFAVAYDPEYSGRASLRTQVLPNGQIIWDIAGNVAEWVDEIANADDGPISSTPASGWLEYPNIVKYNNMSFVRPSGYNWTSANGIGQVYTDYDAGAALRGFARGGSWQDGAKAGVFALDLSHSPNEAGDSIGFRCAR